MMAAAIAAEQQSCDVTVLEKNEKTGKKMYITGKGRCNLTNDCSPRDFLQNVVTNPKFLQGAINRFSPADAIELCRSHGLALKTERGNRVFPVSNKSSDVIKLFTRLAERFAKLQLNCEVKSVSKIGDKFHLQTDFGEMVFDKVIVATGGRSYSATGSSGFGYAVAKSFGHTIVPIRPALCRLKCCGTKSLEGLSLKNVCITFANGQNNVSEFGEMLFADDGITGPAALSLSSKINKLSHTGAQICINLKPALDFATLDARIVRDFSERMNKNFQNALDALLPERLIAEVVRQSGIPADKKINQVTFAERQKLVSVLQCLVFPFTGLDDVEHGIVTSGGVDVKEVNPSTMESKLVSGLYFCGEVLDVDALTGGFNMQIALSTGYVAGLSAACAV